MSVRFHTSEKLNSAKYEAPSFAASKTNQNSTSNDFDNSTNNAAAPLEMSLSRFSLPTLSSSRNNLKQQSGGCAATDIPPEVAEIAKLTPRERIKREFKMRHRAQSHQRPTSLFGSHHDKEVARRDAMTASNAGFKSEQMLLRQKRDEEKQALRLQRSQLAMSQSMAVEMGTEEKVEKKMRPSSWALNSDGADRHRFQVNWPLRGAGDLPTIPDKWSGPGPGAYGRSTSLIEAPTVKGL